MSEVIIRYRADRKKWQLDYYHEGKRKRPLFSDKREAENEKRKLELGLRSEPSDSLTIADASIKYFETVSVRKDQKSRANDKRYLNLHEHYMFTVRGIERIKSVQLDDLEGFRDWLPQQNQYDGKPMSMGPSSVNRCLAVLKHFFKRCVIMKYVPESPALHLEFLDVLEQERRAMTADEYLRAREHTKGWVTDVLDFTFLTGSPPSCVSRLIAQDVDLAGRSYSILRKKGRKAQWKRIHYQMIDEVFAILVRRKNLCSSDETAVFRDERGKSLRADRITKECNKAIRAAGIKGVTLYSLRHALASDLTAANVSLETIRQALGHSSITTTQRYAKKIGGQVVRSALEVVRGDKLGTNSSNEQRIREEAN